MIRDRWSMDAVGSGESAVLRVAVGPNGSTGNFNSIVTFRQEGNDLVESGRLDDLGIGEEIESVRWFDTLAIVVTFRQVDPLYAIDLTDPDQPVLMGSLKIPGYSAYLHPLGQHRLLGLGQLQGSNGRWGAQAGLFNVTDLTNPQQLDVVEFGPDSQALAAQDPRQLTWLPTVAPCSPSSRTTASAATSATSRCSPSARASCPTGWSRSSTATRWPPSAWSPSRDGRVVLVTGDDASFFEL